jgi:hypothetical protein
MVAWDDHEHSRLAAASSGCGGVFVGVARVVAQVERIGQCAGRRWAIGAQ